MRPQSLSESIPKPIKLTLKRNELWKKGSPRKILPEGRNRGGHLGATSKPHLQQVSKGLLFLLTGTWHALGGDHRVWFPLFQMDVSVGLSCYLSSTAAWVGTKLEHIVLVGPRSDDGHSNWPSFWGRATMEHIAYLSEFAHTCLLKQTGSQKGGLKQGR